MFELNFRLMLKKENKDKLENEYVEELVLHLIEEIQDVTGMSFEEVVESFSPYEFLIDKSIENPLKIIKASYSKRD